MQPTETALRAAVKLYAALRAEQDTYHAKYRSAEYGYGSRVPADFNAEYLQLNSRAAAAEKRLREMGEAMAAEDADISGLDDDALIFSRGTVYGEEYEPNPYDGTYSEV